MAGTLPILFVSADVYTKPFFDSNLTADLKPLAAARRFDLSNFDPLFLSLAEYDDMIGFLPRARRPWWSPTTTRPSSTRPA